MDNKSLPTALDLEEAVLGAIMLEADAFGKIVEILNPSDFYKNENEIIFDAMVQMNFNNEMIDLLTLNEKLSKNGKLKEVGGSYYIAALTNKVSSSANITTHARIIKEKSILRKLITLSDTTIQKSYDNQDVFEIGDNLITEYDKIINGIDINNSMTASEILTKTIEIRKENKSGLAFGFDKYDKFTNGAKGGDFIVLAGRPGMGKTALVLKLAANVAEQKKTVLFFSLEMSKEQLLQRIESQISGIKNRDIVYGNYDATGSQILESTHKRLHKMLLIIDDTPALSITQMKSRAKRVKAKFGVSLIIVDYLQLMQGDVKTNNREAEISSISRGLKALAKDLDIPLIGLSQLSRKVEERADKRPLLSDLRESGAIEQDADMVLMLFREKYYNDALEQDIMELIIRKHRAGGLGTFPFRFEAKTTNFFETDEIYIEMPPIKHKNLSAFAEDKEEHQKKEYGNGMDFNDLTPF